MQPACRVPRQHDRQQRNIKQRHPEAHCVICQYSLLRCIISLRNKKRAKRKAAPASKYLKKTPCLEEARTIGSEHSAPQQQLQIRVRGFSFGRVSSWGRTPRPAVRIRQETAGPERGSKGQLTYPASRGTRTTSVPPAASHCYHVTRILARRGENWGRIRKI